MKAALINRLFYTFRTYAWMADFRRFLRPLEVKIDRPIFLVGTQGGGLTLLSRMLRRHPEVISAAGNSDYWTSADEIQNVFGAWLPSELSGMRFKAPRHPVLTAPRSWTYAARDLYPVYRGRVCDANSRAERILKAVIAYCARRFAQDLSSFRFLDKSQSFTVRLGLLSALLGGSNPRFILVTRDPYVSVIRAARGKASDMKRLRHRIPYEERIDLCAEHLGNSLRAVFEDEQEVGFELCLVRFEQLVSEPENTLRAICSFTELDFRPDMLPAPHQKLPFGSRFGDRWYPLRPEINRSYLELLDEATIRAVNEHCGEFLLRINYPRLNASRRRGKA